VTKKITSIVDTSTEAEKPRLNIISLIYLALAIAYGMLGISEDFIIYSVLSIVFLASGVIFAFENPIHYLRKIVANSSSKGK